MFFKKFIKGFFNIYKDDDIRSSYGEDYSREFASLDPVTGRKKVSVKKVLFRAVCLLLLAFYIFIMFRLIQAGMLFN
jgi:hypothetical protein